VAVANLVYQEHLVRSHLSVMPTTKEQNLSVNDEKRNGIDNVLCPAARNGLTSHSVCAFVSTRLTKVITSNLQASPDECRNTGHEQPVT
jgi:hypothetical protein